MKTIKNISSLIFLIIFMFGMSSCLVLTKHDNGNHKGWNKNSNNPHHPNSTNPGKSKGKH